MNLALTESQTMLRDTLRRLATEGLESQITHDFSPPSWAGDCRRLDAMGLFELTTSVDAGGSGLGTLEACIAIEELARQAPELSLLVAIHLAAGEALTETTGEDWTSPQPLLLRSSSILAPLSDPEQDSPNYALVSDSGEVSIREGSGLDWKSPSLGFDALRLAHMDADENTSLGYASHPSLALYLGAVALGIAHRSLQEALSYSEERKQFGQSINQFQSIRFKLAETASDVDADRWNLWLQASHRSDDSSLGLTDPETTLHRLIETALKASDEGLQIHGGYGYTLEYPVSHLYADARQLQRWCRPQGLLF